MVAATSRRKICYPQAGSGASSKESKLQILEVIFREWGSEVPITKNVVRAAAGNVDGEFAFELLDDLWGIKEGMEGKVE